MVARTTDDSIKLDAASQSEVRKARLTVIFSMTTLVVITVVVVQYSASFGIRELTGLAIVWVTVGWLAFFAGSQAYASGHGPRPHLTVGKGIPAWTFFLLGIGVLGGTAGVWLVMTNFGSGLLMAGIAAMFASMAFPRPLSLRRALLAGVGLLIAGIGLVFF
jgi:hypothetical protein